MARRVGSAADAIATASATSSLTAVGGRPVAMARVAALVPSAGAALDTGDAISGCSPLMVAATRGDAPICAQARWVHGATLLVSPHGAHLTNALWMAERAVLLEVMPWGMWDYEGYRALYKAAGLSHGRIKSSRPPPDDPHWLTRKGSQEHSQQRCAASQECRRFYRGQSRLYFGLEQICAALRKRNVAFAPSSACLQRN